MQEVVKMKKTKIDLIRKVKKKQEESLALINKMEALRGRELQFMDILDVDDMGVECKSFRSK